MDIRKALTAKCGMVARDNIHLAALVRNLDAFSDEFQSVLNQALTDNVS